jgi:predicted RNA binding protein with dsRBD fold (UPF0201 family)
MEVCMAKSIRLKTETQGRVTQAVTNFYTETGVRIGDAQMVDVLVNEALNARILAMTPKRKGERGRP